MSHMINNCRLKGAANYLLRNYRKVLDFKSHECTVHFVDTVVTVIDFMLKMQKVKDPRIMDLRWVVRNTMKADCDRLRQEWLPVIAHKWSWLGETAALWSCLSPALDIHSPYCPPPLTTLLVPPKDCECLTSQKSDPRGSLLLPQAPANLSPLHRESIWKVRRDRRGDQGGLLWSIDTVTDTTVELSDCFSLFTGQIQTPPPQSHTHTTCVSVGICGFMSVSFSVFIPVFPSFCLLFPSLTVRTDHADYDVCTAGLDRAVQETCGLQIPCWHTDLTCLSLFKDLEF